MTDDEALLRMENVSKAFPGVQALDRVNLEVRRGEILGLVGENGAGKSTLMKILPGAYPMDSGQIYLEGQPIAIKDPHHALHLGISVIYQEFNLMPNLTVMENIFVGTLPGAFPLHGLSPAKTSDGGTIVASGGTPAAHGHRARSLCGRAADGRNCQGAVHAGAGDHHGRADFGAERGC